MIRLENVTKKFDKQIAVDNLSLNVHSGEFCILLGESGCGKSTTLRMINRLITPNEGSIFIRNKNIMDYNVEQLRRDIGYVVQNVGLFPHMNVQNNISIVPKLLKWDSKKILNRTKELIELVGLDVEHYLSKYPSELSGGEAQRIGVARALAADPDIILMDEPFGAVDPLNRTKLQNEFLKIQRKLNKTVIFVTHDIDEAMKLGDRIAVMSNGSLKCYETPGNMLKNGQNDFVKKFMGKDSYINVLSKYIVADYVENSGNTGLENYIQEDVTLKFALAEMIEQSVDSLLVKSKSGRIIGMITATQIVKVLKGDIDD